MLVGYNTNISYKDKTYHIQTEDSGKSNPMIVTLLYSKGAILASQKTSYADIIAEPDYKDKVREIMKAQHKAMLKGLLAGKYTGEHKEKEEVISEEISNEVKQPDSIAAETQVIAPPGELIHNGEEKVMAKEQITKSLDDILLNYILKREK
jgi:hypothetical protein